jgi:O-antigen ligase
MSVVRNGLLGVLAFAVLAFGAVEVWAQSLVEVSVALLFVVWAVCVFRDERLKISFNPLLWPLLGFLVLGLAQLALHTTQYAFLTKVTLVEIAAYCIFFFLCTQAFRDRRELTRLAWFLVALCFGVSLFGIAQHFTSDGTIYWFRKLALGGAVFGPFVNRNHFAGFVELTLPIGLALMIFRGMRRDMFPLAALLTVVPIGALTLSNSRAGIIGFVFEVAVLALLARSRKSRSGGRLIAVGVIGFAAIALVAWLGAGTAIERFSSLRPGEVSIGRRASMVRGATHMFFAYPVSGAGLGTLVAVYPKFETYYDAHVVDHVHNDYVELLAEMGILGGICGLAFLWILFRDASRAFEVEQGHFSRAIHAGSVAAIAGLLLHSLVDFNLHIPSNAMLFLVAAHLATTPPLPTEGQTTRRRSRTHAEEGEA